MPLMDRRQEYSWPETKVQDTQLLPERKEYTLDEVVALNFGFRVVGGVREAFNPDVWTVAWEDFDKTFRLAIRASVGVARAGPIAKRLAEFKHVVRKASFYWSRDPDLPYRIWPLIIPEDGGPPKIPLNVEDAKSKMFDVTRRFEVPAGSIGRGTKKLVGTAHITWGRHSYLEKGEAHSNSRPVSVKIE